VPSARFIAEQSTVQPLLASLRALRWLSYGLVLLMAAATSAAVVLAARGALDTHRSTIEIMHGIGATDRQIARLFQRKIALDALVGALAGAAAAAIALLIIGGGGAALAADLAGSAPLHGVDFVLLALLPFAAVVIATLVARAAVLSALRKAP
jgi:cell division transport system permease protein